MLSLKGPKGEAVRTRGLFDDGALLNVMFSTIFDKVKKRLGPGTTSKQQLRMANGSIIPSKMYWEGYVNLGGVGIKIAFEMFDSGGNWAIWEALSGNLQRNTRLQAGYCVYGYWRLNDNDNTNQAQYPHYAHIAEVAEVNLALDIKQLANGGRRKQTEE